jgi:hypothetical protein
MSIARAVFLLGFLFVLACRTPPTPLLQGPVTCAVDEDCHPGACGPCTSGAAITQEALILECAVNPCTLGGGPAPAAACVAHVCRIR